MITFAECELAEFASGESTERIPFVYLPLSGQLVNNHITHSVKIYFV